MSALGQKQTYAPQQAMSALDPIATTKADICSAPAHVRFGPKADMATSCVEFFADPNTAAEFAADY
jgi:hypothetical protein